MFTGLIEETGLIRGVAKGAVSARIVIGAMIIPEGMKLGDSVAVNGVCLTVVDFNSNYFEADVMPETMAKTNLAYLKAGDRVNLERPLKLGDRLGGHIVSGHIDGVGSIVSREKYDIAILFTISAPPEVMRYIIKKGSVAIDGVSLTVVDFSENKFQVSLIPHTASMTTFGFKKAGDKVNLEGDLVGKYIERMLNVRSSGRPGCEDKKITVEFLADNGFLA